jgi:hypothetical protein
MAVSLPKSEESEVSNNNANGLVCDVVHRLYQEVLCLQNVMRFYGTCKSVILFMPIKMYSIPCTDFYWSH